MKKIKLDKTDVRDFSIMLMVVGVAVFAYLYLSNPDRLIAEAAERMGYNATEALKIERVDFWRGIYRTNAAVTDTDGRAVELWQIKEVPHLQTLRYAAPYFPADEANLMPETYASISDSTCAECCGCNPCNCSNL